jgi:flagellar M-ring protein FliF
VRRNVQDLLAPVLGAGNYRLSVTAEVDNDRSAKPTRSTARPQGDDRGDAPGDRPRQLAVGVPGSLSNRPVAVAASAPASDAATARKEATSRQYAYDRSITQIQRSRGRLARMNVAVVLNTAPPRRQQDRLDPAELPTSTRSCAAAWASTPARRQAHGLGLPSRRGRPLPWWQERDTIVDGVNWASWALGGLLLFFLVLRPLTRRPAAPAARDHPG